MLDKCANEKCQTRFKYFGVGLLYLASKPARSFGKNSDVEFLWLCDKCARHEDARTLERLPVIVGPALRKRVS